MKNIHIPPTDRLTGLVVLGRGNTPNGVSERSIANATTAAEHLLDGKADFAITSGWGPSAEEEYPISEADAMRKHILTLYPQAKVIGEPSSTTTFENAANVAGLIDELGFSTRSLRLVVVASWGHAHRGSLLLQKALPKGPLVEVLPTDVPVSPKERIMEAVLLGLSVAALAGVTPGDTEQFKQAARRYQHLVETPKNSTFIQKIHPGRS
ncbi:MAG: YdcF family protein [Candidatus Saccharimonadales bacterium]